MNFAVVLSGGTGSRMNMPGVIKQYILVNDKPVLFYALDCFERCTDVNKIVIVAEKTWRKKIDLWINEFEVTKFLAYADPGTHRQSSILNGINKCMEFSKSEDDVVIIHDAARPMVTIELISKCIRTAKEYGGCMPVLPMSDTIYYSTDGEYISKLLDRETLFAGQAPEAFKLWRYAEINKSVSAEELNKYKGTSEIAYQYGMTIKIIQGENTNFKITTVQDIERFRALCNGKE